MRRFLLSFPLILLSAITFGQITSPDTVCQNAPLNFTSQTYASEYTWAFDTVNLVQKPATVTTAYTGPSIASPTFVTMNYDNGTYYSFVNNYLNNDITRLNYGANPNSTPVGVNLGNFGLTNARGEGIDIVYDSVVKRWYGLVISVNKMMLLDFGSTLANTPTATISTYSGAIDWGHQVTIKKYSGGWIAFVANRNAGITRFDFGSSLTNTPTPTIIANAGGINAPCNFAIYNEAGNWYMLVPNLISGSITRLSFGSSLLNSTPSGINFGNPSLMFDQPRGISILSDCNQLIAYVVNESGHLIKMDFGNSIANTPVFTDMGATGGGTLNCLTPYTYNGTLYFLLASVAGQNIVRFPALTLPTSTTTYYTNQLPYTFTTPGTYQVTLYLDQGFASGPSSYCKQVVVLPNGSGYVRDTFLCKGGSNLVLKDSVGKGATYTWNTGSSASQINVTTAGTYYVKIASNGCSFTDSFHVTEHIQPVVDLGNDTSLCEGFFITLRSSVTYTNPKYLWSTAATTPTISPTKTGHYVLNVTQNGCTGSDAVDVTFKPTPKTNLGKMSMCNGDTLLLNALQSAPASYRWSTGSTDSVIAVTESGTYSVRIVMNGCIGLDTAYVRKYPIPQVYMGRDITPCQGDQVSVASYIKYLGPTSYLWSTGDTTSVLHPTVSGTYTLQVTQNGCTGQNVININFKPTPPVDLGGTVAICPGGSVTLSSPTSYGTYVWSDSSTGPTLTVTEPGTYYLTATYDGCSGRGHVKVTQAQKPVVNLGGDTSFCLGQPVLLTLPVSADAGTYVWSTGSTDTSITVNDEGTYTLTVTNDCGSTTQSIVVGHKYCYIWMPNAFTPNGDHIDDRMRARGNLSGIENFSLEIYNRYGQRVFLTYDRTDGWDGKFNGVDQRMETYFYVVKYDLRHEHQMLKGNFILIR